MSAKRTFGGFRDYRAVSLEDIIEDLRTDFYDETVEDVRRLKEIETFVEERSNQFDDAEEILGFIRIYISLFSDFAPEFKRLYKELPKKVEDRHLRIITDIYSASRDSKRDYAKYFAKDYLSRNLKDESTRPVLDEIDSLVFNRLSCNLLLAGILERIKTYIGIREQAPGADKSEEKKKPSIAFPIPDRAEWDQLVIECLNEEYILVTIAKTKLGAQNYVALGFRNEKTKKGNKIWNLLLSFGKYNGTISYENIGHKVTIKDVSRLRNDLRRLFPIPGDPIPYSKTENAYIAKFNISYLEASEDTGRNKTEIEELIDKEQADMLRKRRRSIERKWEKEIKGQDEDDIDD